MSVLLGHASQNEVGKATGGIAGDQTQKEVCTRDWYNKGWNVLLRPINSTIAEKSAKACEAGCSNNTIGYDQATRNGLHIQARANNYDLSKIIIPCNTDCSAFMTVCAIAGGVTELEYVGNAPTTRTMVNAFVKTGKYQALTDPKYLTSDKYLKRGDILVKEGSHAVMVLSNRIGNTSSISQSLSYPCRGIDISQYQTNLDYAQLKANGVNFAILKVVNKQLQKDPMFDTHYNGCINAGISIQGVYQYSYATTVEKAKIDAQSVIKFLGNKKIPIILDVEDNCQKNLGHLLIDIINTYQTIVESSGRQFFIYSGLSFVKSFIVPYINDLKCKDFWIARYYKGDTMMNLDAQLDDTKKPTVAGINLIGWQFTSHGVVVGASCRFDCNIFYKNVTNKTISKGKSGVVTATTLNVRQEPNTDSNILGYLKRGEIISIDSIDPQTGWYKTGNGWVSNKYITIF